MGQNNGQNSVERSFIFWQDEEKTSGSELTADGRDDI